MAQSNKGKKKPEPRTEQRKEPCKVIRLGIVVGSTRNPDLAGAEDWIKARAGALGGEFRLWHSPDADHPMRSFNDMDIRSGRINGAITEYFEYPPNNNAKGYGDVLADLKNCKGRIEELVIFHHGNDVDEAILAQKLTALFRGIGVPVCRVVWWACKAEVALKVGAGFWTAHMMRQLVILADCKPCGCTHPVELIWPTAGKCYLSGNGAQDFPQTNDGKVNRASWGYRQPDGSIGTHNPQPAGSHTIVDRNPPYSQPIQPGPGTVLGAPVKKKP